MKYEGQAEYPAQKWSRQINSNHRLNIAPGSALLSRWNASMSEWRSGKLHPFAAAAATSDVIDYAAAKQLVVAADRLKALARQVQYFINTDTYKLSSRPVKENCVKQKKQVR